MALFENKTQQTELSTRRSLEVKYNSARGNLLLVILFTAVNILLLVANTNSYFLFSAFAPYMLIDEAWFYTGRYPAEIYNEYFPDMVFAGDMLLYTLAALSVIILAVYFLCWLFSKKGRVGWIVTALVFFSLDTVGYFIYMFVFSIPDMSSVIDILFHAWVIYYLVSGLVAHSKLKKLPEEEELPVETEGMEIVEDTNANE